MSTTEVAALVVAGAAVLGVVVLALFLARLDRTVRSVGESVERLRFTSAPVEARAELTPAGDAAASLRRARRQLADDPGAVVARVARGNPVLDVSGPVVKVLAAASGTARAATRFRSTRRAR